jgi:hypothetical protein
LYVCSNVGSCNVLNVVLNVLGAVLIAFLFLIDTIREMCVISYLYSARVARFSLVQHTYQNGKNKPNYHKVYQMATKYVYQIVIKYTSIIHYVKGPRDFTQTGIFGLKIYHLVKLVQCKAIPKANLHAYIKT